MRMVLLLVLCGKGVQVNEKVAALCKFGRSKIRYTQFHSSEEVTVPSTKCSDLNFASSFRNGDGMKGISISDAGCIE